MVSEYPLKQNKNVLKNMTVLYTYFYNISLNLLRPTFFNLYNLPFLCSRNISKIRVKVGIKTNYFFLIYELLHQQNVKFSIIFCHWKKINNCFLAKHTIKTCWTIAIKNEWLIIRKNAGTVLCSGLLEMCVQSLKLTLLAVFTLELIMCSSSRNVSVAKFL